MASELVDVFDELGRHRGVLDRSVAHAEGWWHQVFHLLIVARRPAGASVILQRRASAKSTFPGLLDLSATGHLAAGERPIDGLRELREELGIELDPESLVRLGVRRLVDETVEGTNREFCNVYLALDHRALSDYQPDPAEVDGVVELEIASALDLFHGRADEVDAVMAVVGGGLDAMRIGVVDFVPEAPLDDLEASSWGYWSTVLVMADRLARGDTRLAI
jgi:isopentenyldiphosphate isomerase